VPPQEHLDADATSGIDASGLGPTRAMDPAEMAGAAIGRYRLLQKIGEGGMGEVWLAEQKEPVRRRVALKLIKAGMNTREVIARFASERQALALMDHPAIAKVFDAGSTSQGAPYFVMEYVAGVPITAYCDNHRLSTRERLELFIRVCEGMQHAHQKAIIHRDLKPSNMLVTEVDGKAAPKIIDFGVAKALTQRLTADTVFTRAGVMIGTPEYMSPEQALSSGEDIDTRTDVYSLGIILYQLLAGVPPLELRKIAFDEFLRRLREEDPPKPSTKIRTQDPATSAEVARQRQTEPQTLAKQMRGDLDSIALKALEKERSRRYGSPSDLAADIGRYLRNEPVLAVPASAAYRSRKFAHRHRATLVTLCAFALVLILAAVVSVWQGVRATRQRSRADEETAIAKAVNQFLQDDLLSQANPDAEKPDPDIKVRVLLDRAAAQVGKRFAHQPLVESAVRRTIGNTYRHLGLWSAAEQQMRRAYELSRAYRGASDLETLDILRELSYIVSDQGKDVEALNMTKTVFEAESRKLGPEAPRTVHTMQDLGVAYLGVHRYAQAEPLLKKALEVQSRSLGYDNILTLYTIESLAALYIHETRYAEAEALLSKALESCRHLYGPDHPNTQREMFGLVRVLFGEGKYPEAENLATEGLAVMQRVKGPRHPDTLTTARQLGQIYTEEGKWTQAISLLEKTAQDLRETLGPAHQRTLSAESALAWAYDSLGDLSHAEHIWRGVLQGYRQLGSDGESDAADITELLGQNLIRQRKCDQAESLLRQALAFRDKTDSGGWERFRAQAFLGAALAGEGKYAEAETLLVSGYRGLQQHAAAMPANQRKWLRSAGDAMVGLYVQWDKPVQAAQWRAKIR
jgi:non-specific serine/threonine protein kinase/serine/threonine-protein kinase